MKKSENAILNRYLNSDKYGLDWCYDHCSRYKYIAESRIKDEMERAGGTGYKIISFSPMMFTCGYIVKRKEKQFLIYHTRTKKIEIEMNGAMAY